MEAYPATFDTSLPARFERPQIVLRILILILLSVVSWLFWVVYLAPPIVAAVLISGKGGERFLAEDGPRFTRWLRWFIAADAYIALLTDRFPTQAPEDYVKFEIRPTGSPSVGSALLRLIYSIPSALVLALLGIAVSVTWIIAAIFVLVQESYPEGLYNFHRANVRWFARLLAYHSSLVEQYPPFAIDTGPEPAGA